MTSQRALFQRFGFLGKTYSYIAKSGISRIEYDCLFAFAHAVAITTDQQRNPTIRPATAILTN